MSAQLPEPVSTVLRKGNTHFVGKAGVVLIACGVLLPSIADMLPHGLQFLSHAADKLGDILIAVGTGGAYYGKPDTIKN